MKYLQHVLTYLGLLISCVQLPAASAIEPGYSTLRNSPLDVEAPAAPMKKTLDIDGILPRQFVQQPPLIPHSIRGYQVDKDVNTCLACHSWKNARKWGATRVSVSHFYDRKGNQLADVSPDRYFCQQCHVTQDNAKPLVGNDFKPVQSLAR